MASSRLCRNYSNLIHVAIVIAFAAAPAAGARLSPIDGSVILMNTIRLEQVSPKPNLIPNSSFEQLDAAGFPAGWQWDPRNTDSTCTVDNTVAHSGKRSLHFTHGTPFGANVYGMVWAPAPIPVATNRPYTLSAWVKADDPGTAWIGGGAGWQFRLEFQPTGGQWKRFSMVFTPDQPSFAVRIVTEAPSKGFWVDDVRLEDSAAPTPEAMSPNSNEVALESELVGTELPGDGTFQIPLILSSGRAIGDRVEISLDGATLTRSISAPAGNTRLIIAGRADAASSRPRVFRVRVLEGQHERGSSTLTLHFVSPLFQARRLQRLSAALPRVKAGLDRLKAQHQDTSYPEVTYSLLSSFVGYVQQDLDYQQGTSHPFLSRARRQLDEMEPMLNRVQAEIAAALAGRRLPEVPRWTGAARPRVVGPSFIGPVRNSEGAGPVQRPIFFTGFGHFGQVVKDVENFPHYGANIIQIETGPNAVFPRPGPPSPLPARNLKSILDRARRAGVAVNLLISPHYFPEWMLQKYPELRKRREGFLQYCLHAPESRDLLKRYVTALLTPIKDNPALQSICLSNEPVNAEEPCVYATAEWHTWLKQRHGSVQALNDHWGSHYGDFDSVPLPNPFAPPAGAPWMDFVRFNEDFFAGWHRMLADAVHAVAPRLPVHAKPMTWTFFTDSGVRYGVDPTLFGRVTNINGNDSTDYYNFGAGEFAQGWQGDALPFDLQRSVKNAPVFNSENHLLYDNDLRPVPPEHVRAVLWQSAVHGESATTIWVWERSFNPASGFFGDIMFRPACAEAVGRVNLDLNRAALEVTALQAAPPDVLILQGPTPAVWDGGRYLNCLNQLYTALSFTGLKIGFITEAQLEAGRVPSARVVFIPGVGHLSAKAVEVLSHYQGHLVFVGGAGSLMDEYNHPLPALPGEIIPFDGSAWQKLWQSLGSRLAEWRVLPAIQLKDAAGQPIWGVEWRCASTAHGEVVNLCNERNVSQSVQLQAGGHRIAAVDVLTGAPVRGSFLLRPLQVRLVRLSGLQGVQSPESHSRSPVGSRVDMASEPAV